MSMTTKFVRHLQIGTNNDSAHSVEKYSKLQNNIVHDAKLPTCLKLRKEPNFISVCIYLLVHSTSIETSSFSKLAIEYIMHLENL